MKRLPKVFLASEMRDVWYASRDSSSARRGAPGIDRVRAGEFGLSVPSNISKIREQIRSGSFRFSKLRIAPILKASGEFRIIAIPTVRDRLVQRVLLAHLEQDKKLKGTSKISFGFSKGKTLSDAQKEARRLRQMNPWVLNIDIIKFFDQIDRGIIKKLILKEVKSKIVAKMLLDAVDCELEDNGGFGPEIARNNGIKKGRGLRQGMPVSPMLSNLLLKKFDELLEDNGLWAIRYADDISVFCKSRRDCEEALEFMRKKLLEIGLKIPDISDNTKTKIFPPSSPVEFLGVIIKLFGNEYKLCCPFDKLEKIDAAMAKIASIDSCIKSKKNIGHVVRSLDALVTGHIASMLVLDNIDHFKDRVYAFRTKNLNSFVESLIGKNAAKNLDSQKRAILGIVSFEV